MARILLPRDLQHEVRHAVSVHVCAEGGGIAGGVIGQGGLPSLFGEAVHEAKGLVAGEGGVGVDLRQVDIVAIGPAKVGDLVRCGGGAVGQCRKEEGIRTRPAG